MADRTQVLESAILQERRANRSGVNEVKWMMSYSEKIRPQGRSI